MCWLLGLLLITVRGKESARNLSNAMVKTTLAGREVSKIQTSFMDDPIFFIKIFWLIYFFRLSHGKAPTTSGLGWMTWPCCQKWMTPQLLTILRNALIQVNNFEKVPFCHHFINKFDGFLYTGAIQIIWWNGTGNKV